MPKITKITTATVQANFYWTMARVYSDADGGLYGTGECFFAPGLSQIIEEFSEVLVGEDFNNIEMLVERMRWAGLAAGALGGVIWNAITCIETALWDLKGKYLAVPIWQLLGGKFRDEVRIYLDCHAAGALEAQTALQQPAHPAWAEKLPKFDLPANEVIAASAQRAKEMVQQGYTALKFDLDLPGSTFDSPTGYPLRKQDIDWMVELTNTLRDAVGPNVDLAVDAHWRYRANDILQVMKQVESCHLMWFEDPVPSYDEQALAYLRNQTSTPIGTGEHLQLRKGFWNLIVNDLCDVVTPDLQRAGGLAEGKKIADMCATTNKSYAPHMIGSPLALMASAHLGVSIPNFMVCEFHAHDVPFFHEMAEGGTESWFRPGWVKVLDKPGLGVELNEKVGKQYRLPGTRWFDEV
ncbi:MAG TPA: mandelate racemase/muconate lactonizing enzyme family protein [Ktedonobacteraceae bacterium]|jgi:L-alanine-DL-glutamate epimerase-like enolase superfamily enzyme|nr:mandelate racemase/muconate lactonizing enzyme family protein [Ktedonobacteraceae bacterium]